MTADLCELTGRDKEHLIQKCLPIEKVKTPLKFPLLASEKLDGVFCIARYNSAYENPSEKVTIYSRTGEIYKSMEHLKDELLDILKGTKSDYLIFEAYTEGVKQSIISGWCRDTKKQHPELKAYLHDCLSIDEFKGEMATSYSDRLFNLEDIFYCIDNDYGYQYCELVYNQYLYSQDSVEELATKVYVSGGEGLVLRDPSAPYQGGKRNATMLKVKQGLSFDLKVISLEEGKGKYVGMLGKLVCRWKDGQVIRVGSGLTDQQRKEWWNEFNYDAIVGKIVQIDAMTLSSKGLLREPRFKGIRYDKLKGDY